MQRPRCGYQPCSCMGVHFISRGFGENDYCVNGRRVSLNDGSAIVRRATQQDAEMLGLFLLEEYANYLRWRAEMQKRNGVTFGEVCPFDRPWPLKAENKFAVHYRDAFNVKTNIHVFAATAREAEAYVCENGYGFDGCEPLFPRKIEGVELVQTAV